MRFSTRTLGVSAVISLGLATAFAQTPAGPGARVFRGARVVQADGAIEAATIVVRDGRVVDIGPAAAVRPPAGVPIVDLAGKVVVAGFITAHAHVSDIDGLRPRAYTEANTLRQLGVFARYGITTVWSLGGEQAPAFPVRDRQGVASLDRARIYLAGPIVTGASPDAAQAAVARVADVKGDVVKIRVDDNLGSGTKMPPEVYRAVIEEAHRLGLRVAAHIFYLEDAKALLRAGVDMIAHSVRDKDIDDEFIQLMKARSVPYCPTLTRELKARRRRSRRRS